MRGDEDRKERTRRNQLVREAAGETVRRVYTDEEAHLALTVLAACGGNPRKAAKILEEEEGLRVKYETLRYWKHRHPERSEMYARIVADTSPRLQRLIAEHHQALSEEAADIEHKALEEMSGKITDAELDAKDLGGIVKNLAVASGIHADKHALLTGQPTSISATASFTELARALEARGITVELEGEAEELPDVQEVSSDAA